MSNSPSNVDDIKFSTRLRNILLCGIGWCCAISALFIQVTSTTKVAEELKSRAMATVPLGLVPGCAFLSSYGVSRLMDRYSKKLVMCCCVSVGLCGALLVLLGNEEDSFPLICLGSAMQGIAYAAANNFRFLAADFSTAEFLPKALSISVLGAVLSPFLGPEFARNARGWYSKEFRGSYMVLCGVFSVQLSAVLAMQFNILKRLEAHDKEMQALPAKAKTSDANLQGNQLTDSSQADLLGMDLERVEVEAVEPAVKVQPTFKEMVSAAPVVVKWAAGSMALSYGGMAGLMAATPLAMRQDGLSFDASTLAIEAHMLGMFFPSLFTGHVVKALAPHGTAALGWMIQTIGNLLYLSSESQAVYTISIILIGFGWNFVYVSASAFIAKSTSPEYRYLVRAASDMLVLLSLALVMTSSGFLFDGTSWHTFLYVYFGAHILGICITARWSYRTWYP